jgi:signal transduction histidine kinase
MPVEVSVSAIHEKTGWGINAFVRDLSATKRTEQELLIVQKQLLRNERLAAVGQLTATVAHELRNPMGTIRNTMYLLEQCLDRKDVNISSLTERIDRNIQRCDSIVMDLLDFTRDRKINMKHVPVCSMLNRMLALYECPAGLRLVCTLDSNDVALLDEAYFESAFINVLDNAVQAAAEQHPGGGRVEIGIANRDDRIGVVISDNGPGIPAEDAEQVFEPLYSTKVYGVGLGLPTVKKIMDKLGGDLSLSPIPEGGTQAILWLRTVTVQSEKHVMETI